MSKRTVETDIDQISDRKLRGLTPRQRIGLYLIGAAEDNEQWKGRLIDTIPRAQYNGPELSYLKRARVISRFGRNALYDLHTTALHLQIEYDHTARMATTSFRSGSDDSASDNAEANLQPLWQYGALYTQYFSYRRFSEQIVGVELPVWLSIHPEGQVVVKAVEDYLEGFSWFEDLVNDELQETSLDNLDTSLDHMPSTIPDDPLGQYTLHWYAGLVDVFEDQLSEPLSEFGLLFG
ncbi:hypothetical protein [Halococcus sp. IIIV-5B]|uniref:hypothetical protein n=1 Tax=Halococcus sp. IIIV-5B TaxID=2321230 RepID=UPI000E7333E3|nr:hypothetical protein [Halococcus sp. IIIV-5B]RJT07997.1 hypothetical protein D3261_01245 [Halococcus sp. IIIV-5B]